MTRTPSHGAPDIALEPVDVAAAAAAEVSLQGFSQVLARSIVHVFFKGRPVELLAFASAGAGYLRAREGRLDKASAVGLATTSVALLLIAATLETFITPL